MRAYEFRKMDELKQAERELYELEKQLSNILEKINNCREILVLNKVEIKEVCNE